MQASAHRPRPRRAIGPFTDGERDLLTGSSGADWFIVNTEDKVTDFHNHNNNDGDRATYV